MQIFAEELRSHRQELDSLNVYPVPDGDTGTNMLLTQEAVVSALPSDGAEDLGPEEFGARVARASLLGARGNSGVILSQILRGLCELLPPRGAFSPEELAGALEHAAEEAFRAVARPAEGTILSVMRDAAGAAGRAVGDSHDGATCGLVLEAALAEARRSLARTTNLLPQLNQAAVVDAGGKGLLLLLDSLAAAAMGRDPSEPLGPLGPVGRVGQDQGVPEVDLAYEVQYLLEAEEGAVAPLRNGLLGLGDSLVVVGGGGLFNVHVHTNDPDRAVAAGTRAGRTRDVRVVDLAGRVADCLGMQARAVRVAEQKCALVVVSEGEGLAETFRSLGAVVLTGGPGNTASTGRLLEATEAAPASAVIVMADPANTASAAELAASSCKEVRVLGPSAMPAALSAAAAFNGGLGVDENVEAMRAAATRCRCAELTSAECAAKVVRGLVAEDDEVITLIVGADATGEDRAAVEEELMSQFSALRLEVIAGGQPGHFLIGVE